MFLIEDEDTENGCNNGTASEVMQTKEQFVDFLKLPLRASGTVKDGAETRVGESHFAEAFEICSIFARQAYGRYTREYKYGPVETAGIMRIVRCHC